MRTSLTLRAAAFFSPRPAARGRAALPFLAARPMHADEAVHADKLGTLLEGGGYAYDPAEYHGPTLYYLTLVPAWLQGARRYVDVDEVTLRSVPAAVGTLLVAAHALARPALGTCGAALAAALWRDLAGHGVLRPLLHPRGPAGRLELRRARGRVPLPSAPGQRNAAAAGASAGLMLATKETAPIALGGAARGRAARLVAPARVRLPPSGPYAGATSAGLVRGRVRRGPALLLLPRAARGCAGRRPRVRALPGARHQRPAAPPSLALLPADCSSTSLPAERRCGPRRRSCCSPWPAAPPAGPARASRSGHARCCASSRFYTRRDARGLLGDPLQDALVPARLPARPDPARGRRRGVAGPVAARARPRGRSSSRTGRRSRLHLGWQAVAGSFRFAVRPAEPLRLRPHRPGMFAIVGRLTDWPRSTPANGDAACRSSAA